MITTITQRLILLVTTLIFVFNVQAQSVFINEFHYENEGEDFNEVLELVGPIGTSLEGFQVVLYDGETGNVYQTLDLKGELISSNSGMSEGFGFQLVSVPGIQNGTDDGPGSPDGIALVRNGDVLQFLSYEGSFIAKDGPAKDMTSEDVRVSQDSFFSRDVSISLAGSGTVYTDFTAWYLAFEDDLTGGTYGRENSRQVFVNKPTVFFNEIHYDNAGGDQMEGFEIAGSANLDLAGYSVVLYNGNGGASYRTINLEGVFTNQTGGFGFLFFEANGLQNGAPDGLALVNPAGELVQFLSYEGSFEATNGPAQGVTSTDIGVTERSNTPIGFSLQLTGEGNEFTDFTWAEAALNTYGIVNNNQTINRESGDNGGVDPDVPVIDTVSVTDIAIARGLDIGKLVRIKGQLTVASELGGPAFIQDATGGIAVFDTDVHRNDAFKIGDEFELVGEIGAFNEQIQLTRLTNIVPLGSQAPIAPKVITTAELAANEGALVTLENITFEENTGIFFPENNYDISGNATVRIDGNTNIAGSTVPSEPTTITGVIGSFRGNVQLLPRFRADIAGAGEYPLFTGSAENLDVVSYNVEFLGTDIRNFGPRNPALQIENVTQVLQTANADIFALQEVVDTTALRIAAQSIGLETVCSDRFSRSFETPDPENPFPSQKLCFVYNPTTVKDVSARALFAETYDAARVGDSDLLADYPGSRGASSFWSSGRLPYAMTANVSFNGISEEYVFVNIHAKSGRGSSDLARRAYDFQVLKDSLDANYEEANVIILGDYNDGVTESFTGGPSAYTGLIADPNYSVSTTALEDAGFATFVFGDTVIDHIAYSDELNDNVISSTVAVISPFGFIDGYANTTSDHLPVLTSFVPKQIPTPTEAYVVGGEVIEFNQGKTRTGRKVLSFKSNVENTLGAPLEYKWINFASLGFGGDLTLKLTSPLVNSEGRELFVVESSFGWKFSKCLRSSETASIYGSTDGVAYKLLGDVCRDAYIDIADAGFDYIEFVKIVDTTNPRFSTFWADGYDVDGVIGINRSLINGRSGVETFHLEERFVETPNDFEKTVSIYPTKISGNYLTVVKPFELNGTIEIYDALGQLTFTEELLTLDNKVSLPSLKQGVYIAKVLVDGEVINTTKLIK